jgi:hypothetical protein
VTNVRCLVFSATIGARVKAQTFFPCAALLTDVIADVVIGEVRLS